MFKWVRKLMFFMHPLNQDPGSATSMHVNNS
jgi:hypothetical protein